MSRRAAYRQSPAIIQTGRITEVDPTRWLCRVRPEGEDTDIQVSIPSLYSHPVNGEGIHYLPEEGAVCYICRSSDNERLPFLLMAGAASFPKDFSPQGGAPGSMDMFRPFLSPGDIALLTRDGNGLTLKRGGITELKSTSLARILFNPANNQVLTVAQNHKVQTFAGVSESKLLPREKDPDGGLKTQQTVTAKEFAESPGYSVRFRLGATEEEDVALQQGSGSTIKYEDKTYNFTVSGQGLQRSITVPKVVSLNDSARVVDFRIYQDETKQETELVESFTLGMDREGDLLVDTEGATRIKSQRWVELAVTGAVPATKDDKKVFVTKGSLGSTEPVILGKTFLDDLRESLLEITSALNALGYPTPNTVTLLSSIAASSAAGSPYLSSTLESE